jgi:hypothetical protein
MKYRSDFVTNSSSSSFICQVSGRLEGGYDMSLEDAQMYRCENRHTFDEGYLVGKLLPNKYGEIDRDDIKAENCHICQFKELIPEDGLKFLLKQQGITKTDILQMVKEKYKTYQDFKKDIK